MVFQPLLADTAGEPPYTLTHSQSQEISSILSENALEAGTSNSLPSSTLPPVLNHTPSPHHVHGFTHHSPALTTHPILNREPSSLPKQLQVCPPHHTMVIEHLHFNLTHLSTFNKVPFSLHPSTLHPSTLHPSTRLIGKPLMCWWERRQHCSLN